MFTKKKILLILIGAALLSIGFIVYMSLQNKNTPATTITGPGAQYKNLVPGVSTESDVAKSLGPEISSTQSGNLKVLDYQSSNPNFNNQVSINTSGTLTFVRQIVTMSENITVDTMNQKYGNYESVLYGPDSVNGFNLYVYPDKGAAYIGNLGSGIVLEIWYYPPTDIKTFENLYAQDYSETFAHPVNNYPCTLTGIIK